MESPEEVVKVGDEIEVKILRVDPADRKIGLSRKRLGEEGVEGEETPPPEEPAAAGPDKPKLRGGTGSGGGQLFAMPEENKAAEEP